MKALYSILALAFLFSIDAHASKYIIACGEGNSRGPEHAEFAFVDDPEAMITIYLKGEKLDVDRFGFASRGDSWIFTVFNEPSRRDRKYVINEETKLMQEYVLERGGEKKVGSPKRCIIRG